MAQRKKRLNLYIPIDVDQNLERWAEKFDLSKTVLINLSIRAGLDAIIRAISPQDALSPEQWADIIAAAMEKGVDFETLEEAGEASGRGSGAK